MKKLIIRTVLLGVLAGGLCGAMVGLGMASPLVGVGSAAAVGAGVAVFITRARQRAG